MVWNVIIPKYNHNIIIQTEPLHNCDKITDIIAVVQILHFFSLKFQDSQPNVERVNLCSFCHITNIQMAQWKHCTHYLFSFKPHSDYDKWQKIALLVVVKEIANKNVNKLPEVKKKKKKTDREFVILQTLQTLHEVFRAAYKSSLFFSEEPPSSVQTHHIINMQIICNVFLHCGLMLQK